MNIGLITYIILEVFSLGFIASKHGETKKPEKYNVWVSSVVMIVMFLWMFWIAGWKI